MTGVAGESQGWGKGTGGSRSAYASRRRRATRKSHYGETAGGVSNRTQQESESLEVPAELPYPLVETIREKAGLEWPIEAP